MEALPKRIAVLVVDDHDLFRVGLALALNAQDDIEVVAQASRASMAIRLSAELRPDVVLLDLRLPELDGPEATQIILQNNPQARVLILTVIAEEADIAKAVEAGASGYLLKDAPISEISAAIRAAASGNAWLSPSAAKAVLDHLRRGLEPIGSGSGSAVALSPRELEVLRRLARGLDNYEIATELSISPRTVKNHVSSILTKLSVTNRIQAAIYAVRAGMV